MNEFNVTQNEFLVWNRIILFEVVWFQYINSHNVVEMHAIKDKHFTLEMLHFPSMSIVQPKLCWFWQLVQNHIDLSTLRFLQKVDDYIRLGVTNRNQYHIYEAYKYFGAGRNKAWKYWFFVQGFDLLS